MATTTMTMHMSMSLECPIHAEGYTDYSAQKVWVPDLWRFKPGDTEDRVYIGEREVEVELPDDFNPVPAQVAALKAKKRAAMDAYQKSVAEINEQLSKLLAIQHDA